MASSTSVEISTCSTIDYRNSSLFASPLEPHFNKTKHGITEELLQNTFEVLKQSNETRISESLSKPDSASCFKDTNSVLFLFELCRELDLTPDVHYRAADLFHRFMVAHVEELYKHVLGSVNSDSPINWSDVEERLKHQITLRAVSCVQLASKLSSHYHIVTLNRARVFLSKCGFRYAHWSIVQSEIRILKTIKFRVHNPTPLEYIEAILGGMSKPKDTYPIKPLHGIAIKLLDMFYLTRENVLLTLAGVTTQKLGEQLSGLQVNSMLLAAGIVTASSLMICGLIQTKIAIELISVIADLEPARVTDFAWALMNQLFREKESKDMLEDI